MIKKYLVCGKQVFLTSKKFVDSLTDSNTIIEVIMPITRYWEIKDLISKVEFIMAQSEDQSEITDLYKKIFQKAAPYGVMEKDRQWLYAKGKGIINPNIDEKPTTKK